MEMAETDSDKEDSEKSSNDGPVEGRLSQESEGNSRVSSSSTAEPNSSTPFSHITGRYCYLYGKYFKILHVNYQKIESKLCLPKTSHN